MLKPTLKIFLLFPESAAEGDVITLFVGGVDKMASEDDVTSFFSEGGVEVASVRKLPNKA